MKPTGRRLGMAIRERDKKARAAYMQQYRLARREAVIALLGGRCAVCGCTSELEIDHVDPATKSFTIAGFSQAWGRVLEELEKCQLLCRPHHLVKTSRDQGRVLGEHGLHEYNHHGCRCDVCRQAKRMARVRVVTGDTNGL